VALAYFSCPSFDYACLLWSYCSLERQSVTFEKHKLSNNLNHGQHKLCWNRFEQTSSNSGACREGHEKDCVGGIARVYTAVNQLVKERPNAIFLNAGDHFQGTLWYNIHRWNVTALFMNMLPHDAMVIAYNRLHVIFLLFMHMCTYTFVHIYVQME